MTSTPPAYKQGVAFGHFTDGVFESPGIINGYDGSIELTKHWGGTVAFEHYWTPSLRTSWVFGYLAVEYGDMAKRLISTDGRACVIAGVIALNATANQCDPDWSM